MRIVYCIVGTYNAGGMERVLANKANYLVMLGYEVVILTTDQQGRKSYFDLDPHIVQIDLDINYTKIVKKSMPQRMVGYLLRRRLHKRRLTSWLHHLRADVVVSMFDHDAAFLYTINDGSKKVLEIHFSRYKKLQYGRRGVMGWVNRFRSGQDLSLARRYDRFVVLTEEDRSYWGNLPNIQVIPNANSFQPESFSDLHSKRVIAVGRYDHQKAYDQLVSAWKYVDEVHPDWLLVIFGQGKRTLLQSLVEDLGLQDTVLLCGPVRNIEEEYVSSSVFVMTSRYEGLPMALLEAQACGLPLVSYACKCGPRDIILDGKNGFLVDEGDVRGIAEKIIRLIENPQLRLSMGKESLAMSVNFAEDAVMRLWTGLFEKLLTEQR